MNSFQAIKQSLKSVRLFDGGVADKLVAKYSGGMKRRLSVAISLIGDPKVLVFINWIHARFGDLLKICSWSILQVVYMDEPSSGLDPASRKDLWNAVKSAKQNRAIILTSTITLPSILIQYYYFPFRVSVHLELHITW
jgi:ABC-type multidrug transport system ATPase subunit